MNPVLDDHLRAGRAAAAEGRWGPAYTELAQVGRAELTPDDVVAEAPGGVRSLYVALTRPTQRLVTLDLGRPGRWRP